MLRIRKVLLVALILLSLGLSYQVTSYSSASVKNNLNVAISSSENALIAIPEDIYINIQAKPSKAHTESATTDQSTENEPENMLIDHNLSIQNNMQKNISVRAVLKNNNDLLRFSSNQPIMPGNKVKLSLDISGKAHNIDRIKSFFDNEDDPLILIIYADWDGGSAKIEKDISIIVESNELIDDKDLGESTRQEEKADLDTNSQDATIPEDIEEQLPDPALELQEETNDQNEEPAPTSSATENTIKFEEENSDEEIEYEQSIDTQEDTTSEDNANPGSDYDESP